ncbi:hypothetical protein AVEN_194491-1 [Araneus ventricosus]|uniref:Uncharacterized protein n=1 Tax=Araneus ventricosus TaxID=182803 RepID=A0A4Y2A628_ARAVE|nr:hypothetical protein AVEN_194491-1 [Araneus ventricosus]
MKSCTLLGLLLAILTIEKLNARTLFSDERLYPEVQEFGNNFLSFILSQPVDSLQEKNLTKTIDSLLQLMSGGRRLVYDKIQPYNTNFAFLAADKLYGKINHRPKNEALYTKAELFHIFLEAFKRAGKTVDCVLKPHVMDCITLEAGILKPDAVSSNGANDDFGFFRLFTSLLNDNASVESSGNSHDYHVIGKEFEKALPELANKNIKSSSANLKLSFNSVNAIRNITNNLQDNLQSSKLFCLIFSYNLPVNIANEYLNCFVKSVASIKELNLFNVSYVSDIFAKDDQIATFNYTTQFYANVFSSAVSEFIRKHASEVDLNFISFISNLPKHITNAFSDNFFQGCSEEKLYANTSASVVENSQKSFKLSTAKYFSQSQLEITFNITHKLIKISEEHSNKHKSRIILALKLTLLSLTKTFGIPDNVFLAVFNKSSALFEESPSTEIYLTFTVLDIMKTLNGVNSFHSLNSSKHFLVFARTLVQRFRENFVTSESQFYEQQDSATAGLKQENSTNSKLPLEIHKKISVDFIETPNRSLKVSKSSEIFQNETAYKEWHGSSLVFAKQIYKAILSFQLFHNMFYRSSKYVSNFCSCVIAYHFSDPLKLESYTILTLVDIYIVLLSSHSVSKEKFAQNFAIQIAFWFNFNGFLFKDDVFTLSTSIVDIVLKYVRSCNNLKPIEDNPIHDRYKRGVAFSTQTDDRNEISLPSSDSSEFKRYLFLPSTNMDVESKGHHVYHPRRTEVPIQNDSDASILMTSSSNSGFEKIYLSPSVERKEESNDDLRIHHLHKRDIAFSIQIDNVTLSPPLSIHSPEFKQNRPLLDIKMNYNKNLTQSNNFNKETVRTDKTNDSKSLMSLKDSFKSLLHYNLISSSVFKEVMHSNISTSCAMIYAQEIARVLLKNSPWSALNETSVTSALTEKFSSKMENYTALDFVDIFANRISDIAEKFSLIEKNRLNDVATAAANSITSYFTKRVSSDFLRSGNRNLCKSETDLGLKNEEKFHSKMSLVNHTLLNSFKYKVNGTFLRNESNNEPQLSIDYEKVNADNNRTDILSAKFASILQKNLVSSDKFLKAFYDGLPFPVASAYAFSMAKSLASCLELRAVDEAEFSLAFEAALNTIGAQPTLQSYSQTFSSEIAKLLSKEGILQEYSLTEKVNLVTNAMVRGLPVEILSSEHNTFSQNLVKDIFAGNTGMEVKHLKTERESDITRNQIEFSKSMRIQLKNSTNFTSVFYTGFPRDKAVRYFFEIVEVLVTHLNLSKPLISLFDQDFDRDLKLLNEYPKTEDYVNFLIMKFTSLFTSCGIINEIETAKLSQVSLDVILLALYREWQPDDYCLEFGMAHEKGNTLVLGELLCHKLLASKIFKNAFRNMTPREIAAAYVFSMAESLLKDFKDIPESAMSVAFVKGMYAVKQTPTTSKYAAAFAFEIARVFESYETVSWDKMSETVEAISQGMLSGLPADTSTKGEKQPKLINKIRNNDTLIYLTQKFGKQTENFTLNDIIRYELLSSKPFKETFNGSISFHESFELAELISTALASVPELKIVGNLTYTLPYYVLIRNQQTRRPSEYACSLSEMTVTLLEELNVLVNNEAQTFIKIASVIIDALADRMNYNILQGDPPDCCILLSTIKEMRKNKNANKLLEDKFTKFCSKTISDLVYYNFVSSKLFKQFFSLIKFGKHNTNIVNFFTSCVTNSTAFSRAEIKSRKESLTNALEIAKSNVTIEMFAHSFSNVTTLLLTKSSIYQANGIVSAATSLSNSVMKCISRLRRKENFEVENYLAFNSHLTHNNIPEELQKIDPYSESFSVDNKPDSVNTLSILNNSPNSSADTDSLEILKRLLANQERLSLTSNSLQTSFLTMNKKEKQAMRIAIMRNEKTIVLFYRFLLYNLRTSKAFQANLLNELKKVPLNNLASALSKYIINIPDFSSISEQHSFQTYNMSLHFIGNAMDSVKLANELTLATTNLLLYYDLLESNKLIAQAALASIAINKALLYVLGKFDEKHNLNTSERLRSSFKSETASFGGKEKESGNSGSEELLFNEILFSGLSSSRLFSKVFNSNLTMDSATECFPQLAKQLSKVMKHCFIRRKYIDLYQKIMVLTQKKANTADYVKIFTDFLYQILKFSECAESEKLPYQAFDMFNALSSGLSRCLLSKERIASKKYKLADTNQATVNFENFLYNFCVSSQHFCQVFNPWTSQAHAQIYGRAMANSVSKMPIFSHVLEKLLTYLYSKELKKLETASCSVYSKMFSVHTTNVLRRYLVQSRVVFQASATLAAMSKGIQSASHRLSKAYSIPFNEITSFNLFWDNFGEKDEALLKSILYNTPTTEILSKEKENKALISNFTKLLLYNLMSSKLFIRAFNRYTSHSRATKCAFAVANSINSNINSTSISTDLIQAFDTSLYKLQGYVTSGAYASIFSSTISELFYEKNILTETKLLPLSVNVSNAINTALFRLSSMKKLQKKFLYNNNSRTIVTSTPSFQKQSKRKRVRMPISQQMISNESSKFSSRILFEESLKHFLLSSNILSEYLQLQSECSEASIYASKMAEFVRNMTQLDLESLQPLIESYSTILNSLHGKSNIVECTVRIASTTSEMLIKQNFLDPDREISQAALTSKTLSSAISASGTLNCSNEETKNIPSVGTNISDLESDTEIFGKFLHTNLKSFFEHFVRTTCKNYTIIYAEEMAKSLINLAGKANISNQHFLRELLKESLFNSTPGGSSESFSVNVSSLIASFLKLSNYLIKDRLIPQAVTVTHSLRKAILRATIRINSMPKSSCKDESGIPVKTVFKESLEHNLLSTKTFYNFFDGERKVVDLKICSAEISESLNSIIHMNAEEICLLQKSLKDVFLEIRPMKNNKLYAHFIATIISSLYNEKNVLQRNRVVTQAASTNYALIKGIQQSLERLKIREQKNNILPLDEINPHSSIEDFVVRRNIHMNRANYSYKEDYSNHSSYHSSMNTKKVHSEKHNYSRIMLTEELRNRSTQTIFTDSLTYNLLSSSAVHKVIKFQSNCSNSSFIAFKIAESVANYSNMDINATHMLAKSYDELLTSKGEDKDELARKIALITTKALGSQNFLNSSRLIVEAAIIGNVITKSIENACMECLKNIADSKANGMESTFFTLEPFKKSLFYNLQSQASLTYFLENASENEVIVFARAMTKSVTSILKENNNQDENLLSLSLKEALIREKNKGPSQLWVAATSSAITSFLNEKNYLVDGRLVTQAAIVSNAITKGILIAVVEPNSIPKNSIGVKSKPSVEAIFQESFEHNLLSAKVFKHFFSHHKRISDLKKCASEITRSIKSLIHMSKEKTKLFEMALKNLLLQVKKVKNIQIDAKVISKVVTHLFREQSVLDSSRIVLQAASAGSAVLKGVSRVTGEISHEKHSHFSISSSKPMSLKHPDSLLKKFRSALQYNMLSSKIFNFLRYTRTSTEIASYAEEMSKAVAVLVNMGELKIQSLMTEYERIMTLLEEKSLESYIREMSFATTAYLNEENFLVSNRLVIDAAIVSNSLRSGIVKALRKHIENSSVSYTAKGFHLRALPEDKKHKCYLVFRQIFHYNLMSFSSCKNVFSAHSKGIDSRSTNFINDVANFIAELTGIDDRKMLLLIDTLKDTLRSFSMKTKLNAFLYATSSITAEEFCTNQEVEFSRLIYETALSSKVLCDRISAMSSDNNISKLHKNTMNYKNEIRNKMVSTAFQNSLYRSLLSSAILRTFHLCDCSPNQLSLLAERLSEAITGFYKPGLFTQFSLAKKLIQDLRMSNNKCETLNVQALISTVTHFMANATILKANDSFSQKNFGEDFRKVIEKAMINNSFILTPVTLLPQNNITGIRNEINYCQTNIEKIASSTSDFTEKRSRKNFELICESFTKDGALSLEGRYLSSIYYNLISARVFKFAFKSNTSKEISNKFATSIAHAVADTMKCSTSDKIVLERLYQNALLFFHPNEEINDFACTVALTTSMACYDPDREKNSFSATLISNAISASLQSAVLKNRF